MGGFWIGHEMLGDVMGFCAAAHLYSVKIGKPVKVWFDPRRVDACQYFEGVVWVPKAEIPDAVDCGGDPTPDEWPSMNGVKRFYRFMDASLQPTKSFDVHFNRPRSKETGPKAAKLIGLITHGNTLGDIDSVTLTEMLEEARRVYPKHRIVCFGNLDNAYLPPDVEDYRQSECDISWIIEFVAKLDLLIMPHSGPCFIAAGWRVPMWVCRSNESFWDWALNFQTYQVERWWDRKVKSPFAVFDRIYRQGGWNGVGSGPGSAPEVNREFIELLNQLIQHTPGIQTILDIGCGDWQIMRHVDLTNKHYLGVDVVASVIETNTRLFGAHHVKFQVLNPCDEKIPHVDLIIMNCVAQHLPNAFVKSMLDRISTHCRWALIGNDWIAINGQGDIMMGAWHPINILLPPFNLNGVTIANWNGKHITLSKFPD